MSESARNDFEQWFALRNLSVTGNDLSPADMQDLRGESGEYSKYPYMHGCYIGWLACAAHKSKTLTGAAQ